MKDKQSNNKQQINPDQLVENLPEKDLFISEKEESLPSVSSSDNSSFEKYLEDYEKKLNLLNNEKHLLEIDKINFQKEVKSHQDRKDEWENFKSLEDSRLEEKEKSLKNLENSLKKEQQSCNKKMIELNEKELLLNKKEDSLNIFESELKSRESSCLSYENKVKNDFEKEKAAWTKELEEKKNQDLEALKKDLLAKQNEQNKNLEDLREKYHNEELKLIEKHNEKENQWQEDFEIKKQEKINNLEQELKNKKDEFEKWKSSEEAKLKEREEELKKREEEQNEIINSKTMLEQAKVRLQQKENRITNRENNYNNEVEADVKKQLDSYEKNWDKEKSNYETRITSLLEEKQKIAAEYDKVRKIIDRTGDDPKAFLNELINTIAKYDNHFTNALEDSDKVTKELEETKKENVSLVNEINSLNSKLTKALVGQSELDVANARIDGLKLMVDEKDRIIKDYEQAEKLRRENTEKAKELRIEDIKKPIRTQVEITNKRGRRKEKPESINEMAWLEHIYKSCEENETPFSRRIIYAFHTALKNAEYSPITVLAGISGTGKSLLPNLYADFGGLNFYSVPVQPTWDSSESLLGLFNSLTGKYQAQPLLKYLAQTQLWNPQFYYYNDKDNVLTKDNSSNDGTKDTMSIVLLDEMNLAHIELYFADFLSKLEERRGMSGDNLPYIDIRITDDDSYPLYLGRNVMWVGTMNQDETTKALSDKVLDRGAIIDFPRPKDLKRRTISNPREPRALISVDTWVKWNQNIDEDKISIDPNLIIPYKNIVEEINECMAKAGRAIGHRVWQSIEGYMLNYPTVIANKCNIDKLKESLNIAFEDQLIQKIMPKLRGVETTGDMAEKCLNPIMNLLEHNSFDIDISEAILNDFKNAMDPELNYGQFIWSSSNYFSQEDINIDYLQVKPLEKVISNSEEVVSININHASKTEIENSSEKDNKKENKEEKVSPQKVDKIENKEEKISSQKVDKIEENNSHNKIEATTDTSNNSNSKQEEKLGQSLLQRIKAKLLKK